MSNLSHEEWRKRRVKRLKKMLVAGFLVAITLPTAVSIYLGCRLYMTDKRLSELEEKYTNQLGIMDYMQVELDSYSSQPAEAAPKEIKAEEAEEIDKETKEADTAFKVYLTFDDGPSIYTRNILDILDRYNVKATFFVTGYLAEESPELYSEIINRGHSLGMHTYTHVYSDIYGSREGFVEDFTRLKEFLIETTGVEPKLYRFPGGSSNTVSSIRIEELCEYVNSMGMTYFDWNVAPGDAKSPSPRKDVLVRNSLAGMGKHDTSIILLHDSSTKKSTVDALPEIIEGIQALPNTVILPITEDTEIIQHKKI